VNFNRSIRRLFVAAATSALVACSDDDESPSGAISIAVDPAVVTIPQGGVGTVTVSLSRTPGFSNPVTLTVSNLPTGATATVTPPVLETLVASAVIEIQVGQVVAPGNYVVRVNASAEGGQTDLTFTLTVTAASLQ
jgi:hypothetical protein